MTSEKQLENKEKIKMPWQGKVWVSLMIFGLTFWIILMSLFIFSSEQVGLIKAGFWIIVLMSLYFLYLFSFIPFTSIIFAPIVYYILDKGFYYEDEIFLVSGFILFLTSLFLLIKFIKNNRKIIVISMYSYYVGIIFLLFGFIFIDTNPFMIAAIILSVFPLYLQYSCLKHPYFNQNKIK